MSGWDFEPMGEFPSEKDATDWAHRNGIDPRDIRTTRRGKAIEMDVRRSALGDSGSSKDLGNRRKSGW